MVVGGLVNKPKTYDLDAIMKIAPLEERIYRHRCVEAWSIVVPWIGFPLAALLKEVDPDSKAKYVAFQTLFDRKQMPLWNRAGIELPYVEGLRLDEAMHPLALLAVGLYCETLPNQEWRAFPVSGAVEVRFPEYQIDRQDHADRKSSRPPLGTSPMRANMDSIQT